MSSSSAPVQSAPSAVTAESATVAIYLASTTDAKGRAVHRCTMIAKTPSGKTVTQTLDVLPDEKNPNGQGTRSAVYAGMAGISQLMAPPVNVARAQADLKKALESQAKSDARVAKARAKVQGPTSSGSAASPALAAAQANGSAGM